MTELTNVELLIDSIINSSNECTYDDIANILFELYKDQFMYDKTTMKWYQYINNKWNENDEGADLKKQITSMQGVYGLFYKKRFLICNKLCETEPDNEKYLNLKHSFKNIDFILVFLKKQGDNIIKEASFKFKKHKYQKRTISSTLKRLVWNTYIGETIGKTKCLCCKLTDITQLSFNCGHIIAEANGGETIITNLKPICQNCNSSMGIKNMNDFMKTFSINTEKCELKCLMCLKYDVVHGCPVCRCSGCYYLECKCNDDDLELYVRKKLCQNIYSKMELQSHLRFDYDSHNDTAHNRNIIELFKDDFWNKKVVIHSHKGSIYAIIISYNDYNKYNCWDYCISPVNGQSEKYPYEKKFDMSGKGTVEIIMELIRYIQINDD